MAKTKVWARACLAGILLLAIALPAQAYEKMTLIVTNPQGTVVATMTPQGAVTYIAAYRPYGKKVSGTAPAGPGYTGHVMDPASGLVYMQQRYYDPAIGRFISPDPIGPKSGNIYNFNRFAYANNNPVRYIDPTGMFECENRASCKAGTRLRKDFLKAQKHYKKGSPAYNKLQAGIDALGTANDGGAIHVVAVVSRINSLGWGAAPKGKTPTLTINLAKLEKSPKTKQGEAEFAATGRHELQHVMDDMKAGDKPHDVANEFWHEVRGVRAETSIWEGFGVNDPWETWTISGGLNMKQVYKEAQSSTDAYCPNGVCP